MSSCFLANGLLYVIRMWRSCSHRVGLIYYYFSGILVCYSYAIANIPMQVLLLWNYTHFIIEKTLRNHYVQCHAVTYKINGTLVSASPSSSSLLPSQMVRMSLSLFWSLFTWDESVDSAVYVTLLPCDDLCTNLDMSPGSSEVQVMWSRSRVESVWPAVPTWLVLCGRLESIILSTICKPKAFALCQNNRKTMVRGNLAGPSPWFRSKYTLFGWPIMNHLLLLLFIVNSYCDVWLQQLQARSGSPPH